MSHTALASHRPMMKKFKIDNRIGLIWVLALALIGTLFLIDWHGYGENPCNHQLFYNETMFQNDAVTLNNLSFPQPDISSSLVGSGSSRNFNWLVNSTTGNEISSISDMKKICKSMRTSGNSCFWNPKSRVTGKTCSTCRAVCLSQQKSLTFIQFSIGVALIAFILQPGVSFYIAVASSMTDTKYQVRMCDNMSVFHYIFASEASP